VDEDVKFWGACGLIMVKRVNLDDAPWLHQVASGQLIENRGCLVSLLGKMTSRLQRRCFVLWAATEQAIGLSQLKLLGIQIGWQQPRTKITTNTTPATLVLLAR